MQGAIKETMAGISLESMIARRDDLMVAELSENELVMLNIQLGSYYGMDETAKEIWDYLSEPRTIAALVDHLLTRFAIDRETCEREVLAFATEMLTNGLVHILDHPTAG
jgi:hypothetical protein